MNVLCATMYPPDGGVPSSVILPECSLPEGYTLEQALRVIQCPGLFVVGDIFAADVEMCKEDVVAQSFLMGRIINMALKRQAAREASERLMAIAYYHWGKALRFAKADGVIHSNKPAPLSAEELCEVLTQVARHPDYTRQTIYTVARDLSAVTLSEGRIISAVTYH